MTNFPFLDAASTPPVEPTNILYPMQDAPTPTYLDDQSYQPDDAYSDVPTPSYHEGAAGSSAPEDGAYGDFLVPLPCVSPVQNVGNVDLDLDFDLDFDFDYLVDPSPLPCVPSDNQEGPYPSRGSADSPLGKRTRAESGMDDPYENQPHLSIFSSGVKKQFNIPVCMKSLGDGTRIEVNTCMPPKAKKIKLRTNRILKLVFEYLSPKAHFIQCTVEVVGLDGKPIPENPEFWFTSNGEGKALPPWVPVDRFGSCSVFCQLCRTPAETTRPIFVNSSVVHNLVIRMYDENKTLLPAMTIRVVNFVKGSKNCKSPRAKHLKSP